MAAKRRSVPRGWGGVARRARAPSLYRPVRARHNGGMTSARDPLRLLRGALAATLATTVALGGHLIGGGEVPTALGLLVPWWLSVALCTVLAGTRFGLPRMGAAVLGSQALFHGLFVLGTAGDGAVTMVDPPGSHLGHGGHLATAGSSGGHALTHEAAATAVHVGHGSVQMALWHVMAALVTTVLLHRGETLLLRGAALTARLWRFLARRVPTDLSPAPTAPPRTAPPALLPALPHLRRAVLTPYALRGPPARVI